MVWQYVYYVNDKKEERKIVNYQSQALNMRERIEGMILAKQKSTVAMALSLSNDTELLQSIRKDDMPNEYYKDLIENFKKNTLYKNIWIQILDKDLNSHYRSWTDKKGDNLKNVRKDLVEVIKTKKVTYSISSGRFDLTIKAIVPILSDKEVIGILEIISHFNSIAVEMKKFDVDSIVVLNKESTKKLLYPFTNIFIHDYYIANFNAPVDLRERLKEEGVEKYFISDYRVDGNRIVTSYELKSLSGQTLGWYIMFKKIDDISTVDSDFFMFKWLAIGLLIMMALAGVINIAMFYFIRKQKVYYKNIIDSSTNIVIINDGKNLIDVNKVFFKYFYNSNTLEEFMSTCECICDLFTKEDGYMQKEMDGVYWVDYLLQHSAKQNKAKIQYDDKIYYFSVGASLVSQGKHYFSIVLSDITQEEKYKIDLEYQSLTDALTGIGNRRYFQNKITEEIYNSSRYDYALSFVMLDIDYFKRVNDEHGHGVGDNILIEYTKFISLMIRDGDAFCRIGGEEFMIILPHTDKNAAKKLAEKLRVEVENYKKVLPITMSFGVVEYIKGEEIEYILKRVDEALYNAKTDGRNRVVVR